MEKPPNSGGRSAGKTGVMDVKPLRSLAPMFPMPFGNTSVSPPGAPPFVCISPFPVASGTQPGQGPGFPSVAQPSNTRVADATPEPKGNVNNRTPLRGKNPRCDGIPLPFPGFLSPPPLSILPLSSDTLMLATATAKDVKQQDPMVNSQVDGGTSKSKQKRKRPVKPNEHELITLPCSSEDPRELVEVILMTFDALKRRISQMEEANKEKKHAVMKAGTTMTEFDLRANKAKRIGCVPGIEVGDIFYFRIEMYLVGLHAQSMAGIDKMGTKFGDQDDTVAISVVSSGAYEDEMDLVDSLIYTGQGGKMSEKKQADDQKLERGNLALERSLHRANEIRVIRGMRDLNNPTGKIFVYDGLYRISESWVEKGKSGFNVFKYKLLRQSGQPDAFAIWKLTEKWKENASTRGNVILLDMSSGEENIPVCLVNEVDTEKGPAPFSYSRKVKCLPISSTLPQQACSCHNVCLPGDSSCSCSLQNGGDLPYTYDDLLVSRKPMIFECSSSCLCSDRCRNRLTQRGVKHHFEVFRTGDRGWGLCSWDPIRAGSFICEYVGEIIDSANLDDIDEENVYVFEPSNSDEKASQWNYGPELLGEPSSANSMSIIKPLPVVMSAKQVGNVARFMNHSCSPNVFWQFVQYGHGVEKYPHIMFFAYKHIPPMTELTYDYGSNSRKPKKCLCGSAKCRGSFN